MSEPSLAPAQPPPAWRIGLVGAPNEAAAAALARLLRETARRLMATGGPGRPAIRLVTSLEEGSGPVLARLAAELAEDPATAGALDIGFEVILPHPGAASEPGLAEGWEAVRATGHAVRALELDGAGASARRQRAAVARLVMQRSDTLVVLTGSGDAQAATPEAELLRAASREGPAVLWLGGGVLRLVRDATDLRRAMDTNRPTDLAPSGEEAWRLLGEGMARALTPPEEAAAPPSGLAARLALRLAPGRAGRGGYAGFLAERDPGPGRLRGAYGVARDLAARRPGDIAAWGVPMALLLLLGWLGLAWMAGQRPDLGGDRAMLLLIGGGLAAVAVLALLPRPARAAPAAAAPAEATGEPPPGPETLAFWRGPLVALGGLAGLGVLGAFLLRGGSQLSELVMFGFILAAVAGAAWLFLAGPLRADAEEEGATPPRLVAMTSAGWGRIRAALCPWGLHILVGGGVVVAGAVLAQATPGGGEEAMLALIGLAVLAMAAVWRLLWPAAEPAPEPLSGWAQTASFSARLADAYAERWRSAQLGMVALAAVAVLVAVAGLAAPGAIARTPLLALEALALLGLGVLAGAAMAGRWREKARAYAQLATACRAEAALAGLGAGLPGRGVAPDEAWIGWHVAALRRAAPAAADLSAEGKRAGQQAMLGLVEEVLARQAGRRATGLAATATWSRWAGLALLGAGAVLGLLLVLRALGIRWEQEAWLLALAAALPVIWAGFLALGERSGEAADAAEATRLAEALEGSRRAIAAIPLDQPLASQELAGEGVEVGGRLVAAATGSRP